MFDLFKAPVEEDFWKPKFYFIILIWCFAVIFSPSVNRLTLFRVHGCMLNIPIDLIIFHLILILFLIGHCSVHLVQSPFVFIRLVFVYFSVCSSIPSLLHFVLTTLLFSFMLPPSVLSPCPPSVSCVLRVRQFIEMVNGTDSEVRCLGGRSPKSQDSYPGSPRPFSSPSHKASSSQPYLPGTVQLCSAHSHLEIGTCLKFILSANTAPFYIQWQQWPFYSLVSVLHSVFSIIIYILWDINRHINNFLFLLAETLTASVSASIDLTFIFR